MGPTWARPFEQYLQRAMLQVIQKWASPEEKAKRDHIVLQCEEASFQVKAAE
jgi:hypothetical protein